MAQPVVKESPPKAIRRSAPSNLADADADARAAAKALEKKLGRKLRTHIEGDENGALTEAEEEELILARLTSGDQWIPAEEFLEEFKHLCRKPVGEG